MVSVSVAKKEEPKPEVENPESETPGDEENPEDQNPGDDQQASEGAEEKDVLKSFLWDEENRLLAVNNNGSVSCYFYDAAGERTVKLTSETEMVHVNGKKVGGNDAVTNFTAYVSPYFVVSNGGAYTKHIYAASQRIASKLGNEDGFGADPRRVEQAGGKKISDIQKDNIGARYKELGFTYSAPEKEKVEKDSTMDSEAEEKLIFFYHPDHLGSTSYVTDADGNIAQHIEYIPYGEVFVEERNSQFSTNYLFNAKELDNETGLYYYGARYLDPTGAMWLSVDPVFHAGISPYAYCLGNPVKMVDPDGMDEIYYREDGSEISRIKSNKDEIFVLRTQQTTDQMYRECSPTERGNSDPILALEASSAEFMISDICRGNKNFDKERVKRFYFVQALVQGEFDASMNFIGDDGTSGRSDNNNREYSFNLDRNEERQGNRYVQNGYKTTHAFIGPVRDASKNERVETEHRNNHTHPSGVGSEGHRWQQAPSATDIENSNEEIRRVFGMGSKTIYLFNNEGVKATIPFSVYGR